jgi:aarF domain-containing kinase
MLKYSKAARTLELAKMLAKIGLKEMRSGNLQSRVEQAMIIADGLSRLKGAAMKAGQLLSLELVDYFPPEAFEILSRLQSSAHSVDFSSIEKILKQQYSSEVLSGFNSISPTPCGAASIGQVHQAVYRNQNIALKVQYDDVSQSIDADLKILKTVAKAFCTLTGRDMDLNKLFEEFKFVLSQEVNYRKEAELQKLYGAQANSLSVNGVQFVVPKIMDDLCTDRVLCMSWERGELLRNWMKSHPSLQERQQVAHAFLSLYFHEFFKWGLVQTDPNWGNFLIRENGASKEVVLLDFGATKTYEPAFVKSYIKLLKIAAESDLKALKDYSTSFGLIDPREDEAAFAALFEMLKVAVRPFFANNGTLKSSAPFDFADESHNINSQNAARDLTLKLKYSPPPHQLIFLHRKLGGIYSILKNLKVSIDVSVYWKQMLEFGENL